MTSSSCDLLQEDICTTSLLSYQLTCLKWPHATCIIIIARVEVRLRLKVVCMFSCSPLCLRNHDFMVSFSNKGDYEGWRKLASCCTTRHAMELKQPEYLVYSCIFTMQPHSCLLPLLLAKLWDFTCGLHHFRTATATALGHGDEYIPDIRTPL